MIEQFSALQGEIILVAVAFLVAIWNTTVGPSGALTFATMATVLPPAAVIPIHAVTEAASSAIRLLALRRFVDWSVVLPFVIGGLVGFGIGMPLLAVMVSSEDWLLIILGIFILMVTWMPITGFGRKQGPMVTTYGAVSSFLTLFVGATGALVSATVGRCHHDHRRVIGTSSGCMLYQHALKIPIFGFLGFSFGAYAPLMLSLIAATVIGTTIGKRLLIAIPSDIIRPIFKGVITILALNLLWRGFIG